MAFHLENNGLAIPDVHDTCVFAGAADDLRAFGRQRAQPFLGRLIGTVFVPHGRENAQLGEAGFASDDLQDQLVFIGLEPVRVDQIGRDGRFLHIS